jgi:hypothetical protein
MSVVAEKCFRHHDETFGRGSVSGVTRIRRLCYARGHCHCQTGLRHLYTEQLYDRPLLFVSVPQIRMILGSLAQQRRPERARSKHTHHLLETSP